MYCKVIGSYVPYFYILPCLQMVHLYQDPIGEKIFANASPTASAPRAGGLGGNPFSDGNSGDSKPKANKEKVANLEKKVQELELVLKQYQVICKKRRNRTRSNSIACE